MKFKNKITATAMISLITILISLQSVNTFALIECTAANSCYENYQSPGNCDPCGGGYACIEGACCDADPGDWGEPTAHWYTCLEVPEFPAIPGWVAVIVLVGTLGVFTFDMNGKRNK